jgi:4-hydroxy-4-methyl-2-oxoglutarate aldolase
MGGSGALDYRIKPAIDEHAAFCGVALTCDAGPADNLALLAALESVQPGDVIVCTTGSYTGCAVTGDLVLGMARNCGAVAFVTDGCVRDLPGIRAVGLPCYCLGVTPNSPARSGPGSIGFDITLGGHPVASGDVVVGDQDGVVVIPQDTSRRSDSASAGDSQGRSRNGPGRTRRPAPAGVSKQELTRWSE